MQKCRNWDLNALGGLPEIPQQTKAGLEYGWLSDGKTHAIFTTVPSSHYFIHAPDYDSFLYKDSENYKDSLWSTVWCSPGVFIIHTRHNY